MVAGPDRHARPPARSGRRDRGRDRVEPLGSEIHLNVTSGKHNFIAVVDVQTQVRMHQEVELAVDLNKMHLFEKEAPSLRIKAQ